MRDPAWDSWIAWARRSRGGHLVRAIVPQEARRRTARTLVSLLPPEGRLARQVRRGLRAATAPAEDLSPRRGPAAVTHLPAAADPSAGPVPLVLVLANARSGTSALDTLLSNGFPDLHVEGELFYGVISPQTRDRLIGGFPWIDRSRDTAAANLSGDETAAFADAYRARMDGQAVEVIERLLDGRSSTTVVKLLRGQLSADALTRVLEAHRPQLIVLRRVMLFSLASELRATTSGHWRDHDTTSVPLDPVDVSHAQSYVTESDHWHRRVQSEANRLGLPLTRLTYSGLFESGAELGQLRTAFTHLAWRSLSPGRRGDWRAETVVQDRRTDGSVLDLVSSLRRLPPDVQDDLLRLPHLDEPPPS